MKFRTILLGTAACALLASPAFAQSTTTTTTTTTVKHHHHVAPTGESRMDRMERMIEEQSAEIKELKARVGGGGTAMAGPPPSQQQVSSAEFEALQNQVYEQAAATKANAAVTLGKNGRPVISSADGRYTFSPRVDVMGDWASYSKDSLAGSPIRKSGENFRRAQIGFQGKFAGDFAYKFIYDFGGTNGDETYQAFTSKTGTLTSTGAGSGPHVKEAWVSYTGALAPFTFQVGALPPPSNLGDATSADDLLFNERASPSQLSRALGGDDGRESVGFTGFGSIWNASAFLTGDTYGKGALLAPSDGQEALVGRFAIAPWQDPDTNFNVHFGVNGTEVLHPTQSTNSSSVTTSGITFSDRPELRVDNFTLLNTGAMNAKSAYTVGLEAAVSYGPFLLQGEDFWYGVSRLAPAAGVTNPNFSGWYVEGSWVLTGEPRKYNMQSAAFTRPSPSSPFNPSNGDWGAWELAGRYSSTDLDYHLSSAVVADRVIGGDQTIWSAGLNFYPNDILKFMLDWQDVDVKNVQHIGLDAKYDAISVRTQVTF